MSEFTTAAEPDTLPADFVQRINTLPATATVCIRKQFQVPDGWVIVAETVLHKAPEAWPNGWIIKRPGDCETVHDQSPVPNGYVKVWHVCSPSCSGVGPNAWQIKRLFTTEGK